jgi:hypothetical protein
MVRSPGYGQLSTWNKMQCHRNSRDEVVRRQLAKGDKNKIRGIYNRAAYWSERVRLMQHWANRLDRLRKGFAVPLRKSA